MDHVDARRVRHPGVGLDQGDPRAPGRRRTGQGVPLFPRGTVSEVAHRVERLARAARADHDLAARQVGLGRPARQHPAADLEDLHRVRQPALAGVDAGEAAHGGLDDDGSPAAQRRDVLLGGGVLPHLGVHGRCEDDRTAGGEERVGEQVVGEAVGRPGEQVGGGGGDDDQVGGLPDPYVRHLVDIGPDLGGDGVPGERRPGRRADELKRRGGRYDPYVMAGLGQPPQQLARLVRGDPARDPQHDPRLHRLQRLIRLVHRVSPSYISARPVRVSTSRYVSNRRPVHHP